MIRDKIVSLTWLDKIKQLRAPGKYTFLRIGCVIIKVFLRD